MRSLSVYIWPSVRRSIAASWAAILILVFLFLVGIQYQLKEKSLRGRLDVLSRSLAEATEAGDWAMALAILQANESVGDVHNLTFYGNGSGPVFAGPMGERGFGFAPFCRTTKVETDSTIKACVLLITPNEIQILVTLLLIIIGLTISSYLILRWRLTFLVSTVAFHLTPGTEWTNSNIVEIEGIKDRLKKLISEQRQAAKNKAIAEIAAQVAHDIRSPLSAIRMLLIRPDEMNLEKAEVLKTASKRIESIANQLLDRNRKLSLAPTSVGRIRAVLKSIVKEKNSAYTGPQAFKINCDLEDQASDVEVILDIEDFGRVLSNILQNAIESKDDDTIQITVEMKLTRSNLVINVQDNGLGIPPEIVRSLGKSQVTFGKRNGSGFGLFYANQKLNEWGGTLDIKSDKNRGTSIGLIIPLLRNSLTASSNAGFKEI